MPFTPPDPTQPPDSQAISLGASVIRALKQYLVDMLSVSFDLTTGVLKASAVPNGVTTPYGAAGTIYTSTGPGVPPVWSAPGTIGPGYIIMYGGAAAPAGWLLCDGSTKLIATYPGLAAVLGTTFGGNGTTTFGLPDLRGRSPIGLGTGDAPDATAWTLAQKAGEEGHTLGITEIPNHTHAIPWATAGQWQNGPQPAGQAVVTPALGSTNPTAVGGGLPHNNLHPVIGLNFMVKT